jgi:lycopene cyclase domain-containing protein
MSHLAYLGVLAFVLLGTAWLEVALRTRVYARGRRLLLAVVPVVAVFSLWDWYAVTQGHWTFDPTRTTGLVLGSLPLEEVLFFVVVPLASVLTLEAVRAVKRWEVGDEPAGSCVDGVRVEDGPGAQAPTRGDETGAA